jgi:hypothetical protein
MLFWVSSYQLRTKKLLWLNLKFWRHRFVPTPKKLLELSFVGKQPKILQHAKDLENVLGARFTLYSSGFIKTRAEAKDRDPISSVEPLKLPMDTPFY